LWHEDCGLLGNPIINIHSRIRGGKANFLNALKIFNTKREVFFFFFFSFPCRYGRGSERRISLLRLAIFFRTSKMAFELITTATSQRQKWLLS